MNLITVSMTDGYVHKKHCKKCDLGTKQDSVVVNATGCCPDFPLKAPRPRLSFFQLPDVPGLDKSQLIFALPGVSANSMPGYMLPKRHDQSLNSKQI